MQTKEPVKIGPRWNYFWIALLFSALAASLFFSGEFKDDLGLVILLILISAYSYYWTGSGLLLDERGIRQLLFGITLRTIPWEAVMDALCYPVSSVGAREVNILIRLKGCWSTKPKYRPKYGLLLYQMAHPVKTILIDCDNYTAAVGQYTKLSYSWEWNDINIQ